MFVTGSDREKHSGGYCGGVPPLPIPNRDVKPTCADGTAMQCGRVGNRLLSTTDPEDDFILGVFFLFYFPILFSDYSLITAYLSQIGH